MSIRKKLLLSYIAMIIIPVVVFVLTAILLVGVYFRQMASGEGGLPVTSFFKNNEVLSGLIYMIDYDPEITLDSRFLQQAEQRLQELNAGMAIEKNDRVIYLSPKLGDAFREIAVQEGKRGKDDQHWLTIQGIHYGVHVHSFAFDDGSRGTVVFFADAGQLMQFFRTFFPKLFLALLVIIGLTNGLLTYFVSRSIVRPLQALKEAAEQIREGNLDHRLKLGRKDEVGRVGQAFEEMRQRLRESIHTQLQYEDNRKELLSNISHDLKTPITAIINCVDGMKDGIADTPEKQAKYLDMIHKKATGMNRQIDELFLFSKLDLKRLPFHFEKVDIAALLCGFVEELRLHPQYRDVRFVNESPDPGPLIVTADREKLGRVISNIVDNSIKYMDKPDKEIRFKLVRGAEEVTVTIADNGRGIDAEALPHIFERFYREDPSRNRDTGGSGLGLAIVGQIVEEHGGRAWADSEAGRGTSVSFTLKIPETY